MDSDDLPIYFSQNRYLVMTCKTEISTATEVRVYES